MCSNTQVLIIRMKEGDIILKTVRGVCLNLNESDYIFENEGFMFYFSSEFNKKRFIDQLNEYVKIETMKLQNRYNINIKFDVMFMISLYKLIEKRGFRIYDSINKKEITPSCGFISNIIMY